MDTQCLAQTTAPVPVQLSPFNKNLKILANPNSCLSLLFFEQSSLNLEQLEERQNMDQLKFNADSVDVSIKGLYLKLKNNFLWSMVILIEPFLEKGKTLIIK